MKQKKIAIITFHRSVNYGSVLQAYALQHKIQETGCLCEIIDFYSEEQRELYRLYPKPDSLKHIAICLLTYLDRHFLENRLSGFERFLEERLILGKNTYSSHDELAGAGLDYDIYCAGSDQIWNLTARDYNKAYLLDFTTKRKISYAPSIGGEDNMEVWLDKAGNRIEDLKWIDKLDAISVRDLSAARLLQKFTGKDIKVVLDPAFLLSEEEWSRLIGKKSRIKYKYIFLYTIGYDRDAVRLAKMLSCLLKLPVVTLYTLRASYHTFARGIKRAFDEAPEDFLDLMRQAEYVVTNTFHGAAFSLIFHKQFVISSMHNNAGRKRDERIYDILEKTGLTDRIIDAWKGDKIKLPEQIDYHTVDIILDSLREESEYFLKSAIMKETV